MLPSDLLYEILTLLDSLQDLHCAVLSNQAVLEAFRQRRALILQRVFARQLTRECSHPNRPTGLFLRSKQNKILIATEVQAAKDVISKCTTTPKDAFYLHMAAWEATLKLHGSASVDYNWGLQLVDRRAKFCEKSTTLTFLKELWSIANQNAQDPAHRSMAGRFASENCLTTLAQKLAVMYIEDGQPDAAMAIIREYYESAADLRGYGLLATLMSYCRRTDMMPGTSLITFFEQQIVRQRSLVLASGRHTQTKTTAAQHHWVFCLAAVHTQLGRHEEAVKVVEEALNFGLQCPAQAYALGLGRQLIKMHKTVSNVEGVLSARKTIFESMSSMTNYTASQYIAWSKEYTHDLQLAGRIEEVVVVQEKVWTDICAKYATTNDRGLIYHARNAAWALKKSYQDMGRTRDALEVQDAYESMSSSSDQTQFIWPANSAWMDDSHAAQRDLEIPIMVPRFD